MGFWFVHNKGFIACYCVGESQIFFRAQEGEVGYLLMNFSANTYDLLSIGTLLDENYVKSAGIILDKEGT